MSSLIYEISVEERGRLAEVGELTALAYLADGLVDNANPYMPRLRDAELRAEQAHLLIFAEGEEGKGSALGTLTVIEGDSSLAEIAKPGEVEFTMLAVSPLARGRGVGTRLTKYGMAQAKNLGADRVVLSTMESMQIAHKLYDHLGFVRDPQLDRVVVEQLAGTDEVVRTKHLGYYWKITH